MTELHARFRQWLLSGAPGQPPRDAALHASACDRCLREVGALDALLAVEILGADLPILPAGAPGAIRTPGVRALRALSGVTAVGLLVLAAMIGAGALRENAGGSGVANDPTESPESPGAPDGEGILAGGPSLAAAASVDAGTPSATTSEGLGEPPDASEVAAGPTPTQPPFVAPPPPAITPGPTTVATPEPTAAATPEPTAAPTEPPAATPTPTVAATPSPSPTPTPTPTPPPPSEAASPPPSEAPAP